MKDVILLGEIRELVNKGGGGAGREANQSAAGRDRGDAIASEHRQADGREPLLLRLKELESLERLVEKVGRIDLHAGDAQGFDALLNKLVRLKPAETA